MQRRSPCSGQLLARNPVHYNLTRLSPESHRCPRPCPQATVALIPVIRRVHICKFTFLTNQYIGCSHGDSRAPSSKSCGSPHCIFQAEVEHGNALLQLSHSKQASFAGLLNVMDFCMLYFGVRFHCQNGNVLSCCLGTLRALEGKCLCQLSFAWVEVTVP